MNFITDIPEDVLITVSIIMLVVAFAYAYWKGLIL